MALLHPISSTATTAVVEEALLSRRADVRGNLFRVLLLLSLLLALAILAVLFAQVLIGGQEILTDPERLGTFLTKPNRTRAEEAGIFQALRGSFWIGVIVVVGAFPIGIGAAIYLEEYAHKSRITRFVDLNIRNLAGVPSIVYGILGFTILTKTLSGFTGGKTTLAAGLTVAILVLPIVIITASEAIRAVPDSLREAGLAVGATRWEVIRHHVLPFATPGILTGTVLALARALGEAAPLLLVGAVEGRLGSNASFFEVSQLREQFTAMLDAPPGPNLGLERLMAVKAPWTA